MTPTRQKTPERILEAALLLFNAEGEPNVTTNQIADELDMSPGNLHYHFRSKRDIVEILFQRFSAELSALIVAADRDSIHIEDAWFQIHLLFECMASYRFVYRDLTQLVGKYPTLQKNTARLMQKKIAFARHSCEALGVNRAAGASAIELDALARNIVLVMTYWMSFETVCHFTHDGSDRFGQGAYQVMALLLPYLEAEERLLISGLALEYLR